MADLTPNARPTPIVVHVCRSALIALMTACVPAPVAAHPVPFSYLDVRLDRDTVTVSLIAHIFDVAHDLDLTPPEALLKSEVVSPRAAAIATMLGSRFSIAADGRPLTPAWTPTPDILADRQSLRFEIRYELPSPAGRLVITAAMFPYDPNHQTFVNVYEGEALTQAILDRGRPSVEYFAGSRQGVAAVIRRFMPAGVQHIVIGPDHLLFLVGLLLLGGSIRHLVIIVTAFTLGNSLTLTLAALNIVSPPSRIIDPAIALSIVYVGADNLLAHGGRDVRAWIAFAFGFIHGFGFATVLREMDLPARALRWSLLSFNLGLEVGQLLVVAVVAAALAAVRSRSETAGHQVTVAGSIVVIVAGAFWFIRRVFFPGA